MEFRKERRIYHRLFFALTSLIALSLIIWTSPNITLFGITLSRTILLWTLVAYVTLGELYYRFGFRCPSCHKFLGTVIQPKHCANCGGELSDHPTQRHFRDARPRLILYGSVLFFGMFFQTTILFGWNLPTMFLLTITLLNLGAIVLIFLELEHSHSRIHCTKCNDNVKLDTPKFCFSCGAKI